MKSTLSFHIPHSLIVTLAVITLIFILPHSLLADYFHNPLFNDDPDKKISYWIQEFERSYEVTDGSKETDDHKKKTDTIEQLHIELKKRIEQIEKWNSSQSLNWFTVLYEHTEPDALAKDIQKIDAIIEILTPVNSKISQLSDLSVTEDKLLKTNNFFPGKIFLSGSSYSINQPLLHQILNKYKKLILLRNKWLDSDQDQRKEIEKELSILLSKLNDLKKKLSLIIKNGKMIKDLIDNIQYLTMSNINPKEFPRYPKEKWKEHLLKKYVQHFKELLIESNEFSAPFAIKALVDHYDENQTTYSKMSTVRPRKNFTKDIAEIIIASEKKSVRSIVAGIINAKKKITKKKLRQILKKIERGTPFASGSKEVWNKWLVKRGYEAID